MENNQQLAKRFREVIFNGTWIANTNFKDQLFGLSWEFATTKFKLLNTIADLAQHIHYYINGINDAFKNGVLEIKDKFSFDFKPIKCQKDWDHFLMKFWNDAEEFASLVDNMSDEKLHQFFIDEKYGTYKGNIEGMIEHSYYHLGQIVLIKKMINNSIT